MSNAQRDPRKDPQPGDITAYHSPGYTSIYKVLQREGRVVYYEQTTNGHTDYHDTFIEDWVSGSTDDEVLHVAE